jgi:hypothetical protein
MSLQFSGKPIAAAGATILGTTGVIALKAAIISGIAAAAPIAIPVLAAGAIIAGGVAAANSANSKKKD